MGYIVTAPLVIAKDEQGRDLYLYGGTEVPSSVRGEQLGRFTDEGMIAKVEEQPDGSGSPPARSASKADWVVYATSDAAGDLRLSEADADAATRDELAERFLGPKA